LHISVYHTLNIHSPLLGVKTVGLKSTLLAQALRGINVFVSTIVTGAGVSFGVLVCIVVRMAGLSGKQKRETGVHTLHNTAKSIEDSLRSEVLRGNQVNEVLLASFLLERY
jgi:ribosomal protein S5